MTSSSDKEDPNFLKRRRTQNKPLPLQPCSPRFNGPRTLDSSKLMDESNTIHRPTPPTTVRRGSFSADATHQILLQRKGSKKSLREISTSASFAGLTQSGATLSESIRDAEVQLRVKEKQCDSQAQMVEDLQSQVNALSAELRNKERMTEIQNERMKLLEMECENAKDKARAAEMGVRGLNDESSYSKRRSAELEKKAQQQDDAVGRLRADLGEARDALQASNAQLQNAERELKDKKREVADVHRRFASMEEKLRMFGDVGMSEKIKLLERDVKDKARLIEALELRARTAEDSNRVLEGGEQRERASCEKQLMDRDAKLSEITVKFEEITIQLKESQSTVKARDAEVKALQKRLDKCSPEELTKLNERVRSLQANLNATTEALSKAEAEAATNATNYKNAQKALDAASEGTSKKSKESSKQLAELQAKLLQVEGDLSSKSHELGFKTTLLGKKEAEVTTLTTQIEDLRAQMGSSVGATSEMRTLLLEEQSRNETLRTQVSTLKEELRCKETDVTEQAQRHTRQMAQLQTQLDEAKAQTKEGDSRIATLEMQIATTEKTLAEKCTANNLLQQNVDDQAKKLEQLRAHMATMEQRLLAADGLSAAAATVKDLEARVSSLDREKAALAAQLAEQQGLMEERQRTHEQSQAATSKKHADELKVLSEQVDAAHRKSAEATAALKKSHETDIDCLRQDIALLRKKAEEDARSHASALSAEKKTAAELMEWKKQFGPQLADQAAEIARLKSELMESSRKPKTLTLEEAKQMQATVDEAVTYRKHCEAELAAMNKQLAMKNSLHRVTMLLRTAEVTRLEETLKATRRCEVSKDEQLGLLKYNLEAAESQVRKTGNDIACDKQTRTMKERFDVLGKKVKQEEEKIKSFDDTYEKQMAQLRDKIKQLERDLASEAEDSKRRQNEHKFATGAASAGAEGSSAGGKSRK